MWPHSAIFFRMDQPGMLSNLMEEEDVEVEEEQQLATAVADEEEIDTSELFNPFGAEETSPAQTSRHDTNTNAGKADDPITKKSSEGEAVTTTSQSSTNRHSQTPATGTNSKENFASSSLVPPNTGAILEKLQNASQASTSIRGTSNDLPFEVPTEVDLQPTSRSKTHSDSASPKKHTSNPTASDNRRKRKAPDSDPILSKDKQVGGSHTRKRRRKNADDDDFGEDIDDYGLFAVYDKETVLRDFHTVCNRTLTPEACNALYQGVLTFWKQLGVNLKTIANEYSSKTLSGADFEELFTRQGLLSNNETLQHLAWLNLPVDVFQETIPTARANGVTQPQWSRSR